MTSEPLPHDTATPNLPSRDFDATIAFYRDFGFAPTHRDDGWLILRRGTVQLEFFFWPDADPYASNFMCCIRVAELDELIDAIAASGVPRAATGIPRFSPAAMQPWGLRAGFLIDPDGTQLTLIERVATA